MVGTYSARNGVQEMRLAGLQWMGQGGDGTPAKVCSLSTYSPSSRSLHLAAMMHLYE